MKAILASNNKHKLEEIRAILSDVFEQIYSLKDMNIDIEIEENGNTFEQNSYIKASTIAKMTGLVTIADDSGLCVDALNGQPGVYSARFAGEPCDDDKNNQKLLNCLHELEIASGTINRNAHFESVVVLCQPDLTYKVGQGQVDGIIVDDYRGKNGFGYDPIFFCNELGMTFGEADAASKNKISHRYRALQDLLSKI